MGKVRNKSHSNEIQRLKRENQQLRKEVAKLKQLLEKQSEEPTYDEFDYMASIVLKDDRICPKCSKPVVVSDLGLKELITCTSCEYRKTIPLQY